jgi:hypothetical protein
MTGNIVTEDINLPFGATDRIVAIVKLGHKVVDAAVRRHIRCRPYNHYVAFRDAWRAGVTSITYRGPHFPDNHPKPHFLP